MERAKTDLCLTARVGALSLAVLASLWSPLGAEGGGSAGAPALSGDELALALRSNVVRIQSEWLDGQVHDGFGFIAGERDGELFIVTANHVVRGAGPDDLASDIAVEFFGRQGMTHPATLLGTSNAQHDVAVLLVRPPAGLEWRRDVASATEAARQTPVWFVGRGGTWYVPTNAGIVNSIGLDDSIAVDDLNVQVGTSGAPLIAQNGIVGMVVRDEGGISYAVSIEFIAKAFNFWNHPWQLTALGKAPSGGGRTEGSTEGSTGSGDSRTMTRAKALYDRGDFESAYKLFRQAAGAGNSEAKYYLGRMYLNGQGVGKDEAAALRLVKQAFEAGEPGGYFLMGTMHARGLAGLKQVDSLAFGYYNRAANLGFAEAYWQLGIRYMRGQGVKPDEKKAVEWYIKAAKSGSAPAKRMLAKLGVRY